MNIDLIASFLFQYLMRSEYPFDFPIWNWKTCFSEEVFLRWIGNHAYFVSTDSKWDKSGSVNEAKFSEGHLQVVGNIVLNVPMNETNLIPNFFMLTFVILPFSGCKLLLRHGNIFSLCQWRNDVCFGLSTLSFETLRYERKSGRRICKQATKI